MHLEKADSNALIVFVKNAVEGKVKTRLAASIGSRKALQTYLYLCYHTRDVIRLLHADKYIFYSDAIVENDMWAEHASYKRLQQGANLGDRMEAAFAHVLAKGYRKVCIIGTDCRDLHVEIIQSAFIMLDACDVVVGPAADGGYYLLGLKQMHAELFADKDWSTSMVFDQTLQAIRELSLHFNLLPELHDVDRYEDLTPEMLDYLQNT